MMGLAAREPALFERFTGDVLRNAVNRAIFERWEQLALPDGWLVAGCLFQTVWNLKSGHAPQAHIKDYDLFYFDADDLSEAGERRVQARVDEALADLGATIEASNQARVHLWYPDYFGHPYAPLRSAREGIDNFLVPATCVGMRPRTATDVVGADGGGHEDGGDGGCDAWQVYAPNGLALLFDGLLTPNPLKDHRNLFTAKARSYQARWPWLTITSHTPALPAEGPP